MKFSFCEVCLHLCLRPPRAGLAIENNIFQGNNIPISLKSTSYPVFSNNLAQNNNTNGIVVDGATIIADAVWQSNLPYILDSKSISAGATLTLKGGTIVKLSKHLSVSGQLITEGTLANPVVFTSISDDEFGGDSNNNGTSTLPGKGNWQQLIFQSSATSTLNGVKIRYGGGGCNLGFCWGAVNWYEGANVEIKDSVIEKNIWGAFINANSCQDAFEKIRLSNVVFSENNKDVAFKQGIDCSLP